MDWRKKRPWMENRTEKEGGGQIFEWGVVNVNPDFLNGSITGRQHVSSGALSG